MYEAQKIPVETLEQRVRHVLDAAFGGRRMVIFSGGAAKGDEEVLEEVRGLAKGGAFGSIMGRNAFQRSRKDAVALLGQVMDLFREA